MAAEKLTKARLVQILFMMMILIIAFIWRSVTYSNVENLCKMEQHCTFEIGGKQIDINWDAKRKIYTIISPSQNINLNLSLVNSKAVLITKDNHFELHADSLPIRLKITTNSQQQSEFAYINIR